MKNINDLKILFFVSVAASIGIVCGLYALAIYLEI